MKHVLLGSFLFAVFFLVAPHRAHAGVTCQTIYGAAADCQQISDLTFDLAVQNPRTNTYHDSLSLQEASFKPGQTMFFRLFVKNNTSAPLQNVVVRTVYPPHVVYASGDGTYDPNTQTLTTPVAAIKPNESRTMFISGTVLPEERIPLTEGAVCETTTATASLANQTLQDSTQFCISKQQVLPAQTKSGLSIVSPPTTAQKTPPTGPETVAIFSLASGSFLGWFLRNRSHSYFPKKR